MSAIGDLFGGASRKAAKAQVKGINAAMDTINDQQGQVRSDFAGTVGRGESAAQQEADLLGLNGPEAQALAQSNFSESPGQAFLRERGERALLRNSAAIGGLGGGNVRKALVDHGVGVAATQQGQHMDRLAGVARRGEFANTTRAGIGSGLASNVANLQVGKGRARAQGILNANSQLMGGLSRVAGAFI